MVGDLAQFMVGQGLSADEVASQADALALPNSVVEYFQGAIGIPPGGFPEALRQKVLSSRGLAKVEGRPGASLPPYDFDAAREELRAKYDKRGVTISERDLLSHALYPQVPPPTSPTHSIDIPGSLPSLTYLASLIECSS